MHEDTVPTTVDSDRWLSLADAARALGVSEKTARRRTKAGQLDARQVPTPHGPAWQVRVPDTVPTEGRVDGAGTQAATVLELVRLVGELQAKAEAAGLWQGRAETLAHQLAEVRETIKALQAPPDPQPARDPFPRPIPPTPNVALWWRWWLPWLAGVGALAIVMSASCQTAVSIKHAGLCSSTRASMDFWSEALAGRPGPSMNQWDPIRAVVEVGEKVC